MKSIAFFNNKGGVGKTTLLCNVAAFLAIHCNQKICVVDADPQCNATQYFFDECVITEIYGSEDAFTVFKVIEPLSLGEGYNKDIAPRRAERFCLDVIVGDPRLALTEDLLAKDWQGAKAGEVRGIKTNLVFADLLLHFEDYDYVFFDVSPSLGALNRAIMLTSDFFLSPVSLDIFSLKAFENIAAWISDWSQDWQRGVDSVRSKSSLPDFTYSSPVFLGYVTQAYLAKRDSEGQRRAVQAYEEIRSQIDQVIAINGLANALENMNYEIGTVPNLFSLIPMSQSNHTPVFALNAKDGVVGAHFSKVRDSKTIFGTVAQELLKRMQNG